MKLSHFFIERPIFAIVVSLFITIAGAVAYFTLSVAQYPEIVPPTICAWACIAKNVTATRAENRQYRIVRICRLQ